MSFKKGLSDLGGLVYSTEHGRTCPACGKAIGQCTCSNEEAIPEGDGIVRVRYERKGRNGKSVCIVEGLPETLDTIKTIAKELKKRCGVGGAVKERVIEIQGEHRDLIMQILQDKGYTVKKSGG